jgi:DNA-binding transcriptional MerR regulator/mannose-6-phosphate isomerase-like protein (cupin superfamily)
LNQSDMDSDSLTLPIGAASRAVGVSPQMLRLWENQSLVKPIRSASGTRYYRKEDITRLKRIKRLREAEGLNFAAIRKELRSTSSGGLVDGSQDRPPLKNMGDRLRRLRLSRGKTLKAVANDTDLSVSFLSSVERGVCGASVASLSSIAKAYGISVREIFGAEFEGLSPVVRPDDRPIMEWQNGVRYEQLAPRGSLMDPSYIRVPPHAGSGGFYSHAGEEFAYVLSGTLVVELKGQGTYWLEAKDVIYYPSTVPHRWRTEDEEAEVLYVNTPPSF